MQYLVQYFLWSDLKLQKLEEKLSGKHFLTEDFFFQSFCIYRELS